MAHGSLKSRWELETKQEDESKTPPFWTSRTSSAQGGERRLGLVSGNDRGVGRSPRRAPIGVGHRSGLGSRRPLRCVPVRRLTQSLLISPSPCGKSPSVSDDDQQKEIDQIRLVTHDIAHSPVPVAPPGHLAAALDRFSQAGPPVSLCNSDNQEL